MMVEKRGNWKINDALFFSDPSAADRCARHVI